MTLRTDSTRVYLTVVLVYAAFWNPWLQSSMTWNFLDAAVSMVDTGRWEMAHPDLYEWKDTATVGGRVVSAEPPGMAVLLMPFYLVWRVLFGTVGTHDSFVTFNAVLALLVSTTITAFTAVQVGRVAKWLGVGRRGQLLTALLVAFGTQNFFFGTSLFKEGIVACVVVSAFRLAVEPGTWQRRSLAGFLAGMATTIAYPTLLFAGLVFLLILYREGMRRAAAYLLGGTPLAIALGTYHTSLFGMPWHTGYHFITALPLPGIFVVPKLTVLLDLLVGPPSGMFLYSPFMLLALVGLVTALRTEKKGAALAALLFLVGMWLVVAGVQSQFRDRASWAHSLGPRMMFPAIPLFAAFACLSLEHASRMKILLFSVPSVICGYLSAQAGFIPTTEPFPYAIKTWVSGTGMGVLFKEALPHWMGVETVHTLISRPDVTYHDVLALLSAGTGLQLLLNQLLFLAGNVTLLALVGYLIHRIWREPIDRTEDSQLALGLARSGEAPGGNLKIALVTAHYQPSRVACGVGDYTRCLREALEQRGHECIVITSATSLSDEMNVYRLSGQWGIQDLLQAGRVVRAVNPDVVIMQYTPEQYGFGLTFKLLPLWIRLGRPHTRFVTTFHTLVGGRWLAKLAALLLAWGSHSSVSVHAELSELFRRRLPLWRGRLNEIPIGANIPPPRVDQNTARERLRRLIDVPPNTVIVGTFGFATPGKGFETLFRALDVLNRSGRAHLVCVGESRPEDQEFRQTLETLAQNLKIGHRVHWVSGLSGQHVANVLLGTDVYVVPYDDGASLRRGTLMAGFQVGLPIVTTVPRHADEALRSGETLLAVPPRSPQALAEAITTLINDRDLQERLRQGAASVTPRFTWDRIAAAFEHCVLHGRRPLRTTA